MSETDTWQYFVVTGTARPLSSFPEGLVLAELTPDRAARVAFILATGARLSESDSARVEDVDQARGIVFLRGTKTAGSRRAVPLVGARVGFMAHALRYAEGDAPFRAWPNARRDLAQACKRARIEKVSRTTCAAPTPRGSVSPRSNRT